VNFVVPFLVATLLAATPAIKPRSIHETLARDILLNLNVGQYDAAVRDFNSTLSKAITPAEVAQLKKQFDTEVGSFRSIIKVREAKEDGFPMVELTARFAKSDVLMKVVFDAENRVNAVYFNPILVPPPDARLEAIARGILTNFAARQFELAGRSFDPALKAQLTPERMARLSEELGVRYGAFRAVTKVEQVTEGALRNIDLISDFEKDAAVFRVVFSESGQVVGVHVGPHREPPAAP
jgi:hypothetical protein